MKKLLLILIVCSASSLLCATKNLETSGGEGGGHGARHGHMGSSIDEKEPANDDENWGSSDYYVGNLAHID